MTPPLSISAIPRLTRAVPVCGLPFDAVLIATKSNGARQTKIPRASAQVRPIEIALRVVIVGRTTTLSAIST
jgi:hypothetical protein